jgi:adenine-specific DNA-methyltransferase
MPTLEFKGKSFVYTHHLAVPFRELVIDPKKSLPASGAKPSLEDNLIIHGDNLHALRCCRSTPARWTASSLTRRTTPATKAGATTTTSAVR